MTRYTKEQLAQRRALAEVIDQTCDRIAAALESLERVFAERYGVELSKPTRKKAQS